MIGGLRKSWKRVGTAVIAAALLFGHPMFFVEADEAEQRAAQETLVIQSVPQETDREAPALSQAPAPSIYYGIYQPQAGWLTERKDDLPLRAGPGGVASAVKIRLYGVAEGLTGTVNYQVNSSGKGWLDMVSDYAETGAAAEGLPIEAIRVSFNGTLAEFFDVYYSVWQNGGWTDWAVNGESAGTEGQGLMVEGFRAIVVRKGDPVPEMKPDGVDPARPMVALTFDDGPSTPVTSRILNSLEANGGRATFFMVGNRVHGAQAVVQRMVALGCQVGNHTYEHKYLTKLGDAGIRSQVGLANQKVAEVCSVSPVVVRPPGGYYDQASLNTLASMGMSAIMWNIDTKDWKTRNAQNTINVVLSQVRDGDIVLMHDIYGASADAAEVIIPELIRRGYQLVTVSELAQYRGGLAAGGVYSRFRP